VSQAVEKRPDDNLIESQRLLDPEIFTGLRISRYEIRLRAVQEALIPAFAGSTLRGAFGHALKQAVCVMSHRDCERCLVADRCVYPYVFETPAPKDVDILRNQRNAPHPFVLDPPVYRDLKESGDGHEPQWESHHRLAAGDEILFGLTLMGRSIEYIPYVVYAIQEMAERGMGRGRAQFVLAEVSTVQVNGKRRLLYDESSQRLDGSDEGAFDLSEWVVAGMARSKRKDQFDHNGDRKFGEPDLLKLRFITPTRIKIRDDLLLQIDFATLVRNLMRRLSMLMAVHGGRRLDMDFRGLLDRAAAVGTVDSSIRWWDWVRYSATQRTKMRLGGFVGEIAYQGRAMAEWLPLLIAGEVLRVGNGTGFGLGRYELLEEGA
jgi:hypothetical protein